MQNEIQKIIKGCGIDLIGIADLSPVRAQLVGQGGAIFETYPRAVSLGCRLANEVVDVIADHGNRALIMNYIHHIYSVVNQRLDQAALSVAGFLMERGYLAFPVPASQVLSYETYTGLAAYVWMRARRVPSPEKPSVKKSQGITSTAPGPATSTCGKEGCLYSGNMSSGAIAGSVSRAVTSENQS